MRLPYKGVCFISRNRKGQIWYLDVFIALSIITLTGFFYMQHIDTVESPRYDHIEKAQTISGLLMSPGYPLDWDISTVTVPGVVHDYRVNMAKLADLYSMSHLQLAVLFQTDHNIYIYLEQDGSNIIADDKSHAGRLPNNPSDVAHIRRILLFEEKPAIMHVVVWS